MQDPNEHGQGSGQLHSIPMSIPTSIPVRSHSLSQPLQLADSGSLGNNASLMSLLATSQPASPSQHLAAGDTAPCARSRLVIMGMQHWACRNEHAATAVHERALLAHSICS